MKPTHGSAPEECLGEERSGCDSTKLATPDEASQVLCYSISDIYRHNYMAIARATAWLPIHTSDIALPVWFLYIVSYV